MPALSHPTAYTPTECNLHLSHSLKTVFRDSDLIAFSHSNFQTPSIFSVIQVIRKHVSKFEASDSISLTCSSCKVNCLTFAQPQRRGANPYRLPVHIYSINSQLPTVSEEATHRADGDAPSIVNYNRRWTPALWRPLPKILEIAGNRKM